MMLHRKQVEKYLDQAYKWICKQRKDYPAHDSVWNLRTNWTTAKQILLSEILTDEYKFGVAEKIEKKDKNQVIILNARDSVVSKVLSIILQKHINKKKLCFHVTHIKNHGGSKAALRLVKKQLNNYPNILKSDVAKYYASIDHSILLKLLSSLIRNDTIFRMIYSMLKSEIIKDGNYFPNEKGINRSNPLSPILAAIYLIPLDSSLKNKKDVFYLRYLDDFIMLTKTRNRLSSCVKTMHTVLKDLNLEIAKNKTYIGRTKKGFNFLGYFFKANNKNIRLSEKTLNNFALHIFELYKQNTKKDRI